MATMVKPTPSLVRAFAAAAKDQGLAPDDLAVHQRGKVSKAEVIFYLREHPATTRELATGLGLDIGKRGVIAESVFVAVADSL